MTLDQAITLQPLWVQYWLKVLVFGVLILPIALLVWKQTRITSLVILAASALAGFGVFRMFDTFGYVKLLGLPHVILWTPLAYYLFTQIKREDMPIWPRRNMIVVLAVFVASLVFDYVDVVRYVVGKVAD
jgi:hypothetical protein